MNGIFRSGRPDRRYSGFQIVLHWLVVLMVIGQWYTSKAIPRTRNPLLRPAELDLFQQAVHVYAGIFIGLAMMLRVFIAVRHRSGVGSAPPGWPDRAVQSVHWGLYAALLVQAASGFVTTYLWAPASTVHSYAWNTVLILVALHIAGAAFHLVRRDGVFGHMLPRRNRPSD